MLNYNTKKELNALSKEVFGSSSRWEKLIDKGYAELLTDEVTEQVPSEVPGELSKTEVVKKLRLTQSGGKQSVQKRHTVESVKELMLKLQVQRAEYIAAINQVKADRAASQAQKELEKSLQASLSGSAAL